MFFRQPLEPVPKYPEKLLPASDDDKTWLQDNTLESVRDLDQELATAWQVMRRFCILIKLGAQMHRLIYPQIILETMTAVMYRLLHMGLKFATLSIDEGVRLGLLAFCHHVFLQWQDTKLPYDHFRVTYKNCMLALNLVDGGSSRLMLWLLITGANSLFDISDEPWLYGSVRDHAEQCQVSTWKGMQEVLKSFMWIALLDDQSGKQIYDSLHLKRGDRLK